MTIFDQKADQKLIDFWPFLKRDKLRPKNRPGFGPLR